jgi:all-trans-retinol dehydrogenase (NAD+)
MALAAAQPAWDSFRSRPMWQQLVSARVAWAVAKEVGSAFTERSLKGEVCVITGAGSGMGRCMALMLAKEGVKLALWDLDKQAVDAVAAECAAHKTTVRAYRVDVTDTNAVRSAGERTLADFDGKVDILLNNAGIVSGKALLDPTFDEKRAAKTIEVNTTSLIWVTRAFLPSMVQRDHGHIVTMASQAGLIVHSMTWYGMTWHGMAST